jgi:hypothetical protein
MNALREWLTARPWWVTAIGLFCAYMTLIYVPFDLFWKPVAEDQEVWFGIVLHGWWAKATEPLHWAIYAAGTWGFLRERPWIWVASSLYVGQIAIGMLVWSVTDPRGGGWVPGIISGAIFAALAILLWRQRRRARAS